MALLFLVSLVTALATILASIAGGSAPAPWITAAVAAVVIVGLAILARSLWRSTRSIGALMDAADQVAGGDYATRVGRVPGRQLQRLAGAFDQMTEHLETNEARRRELLADIAHELRTPLQAVQGSIEGMLDGLYPTDADTLRPVLQRTETMARLLDDLRTLSMAEAGVLALHREPVDPAATARDAIETVRSAADQADVALEVTAADAPATIDVDPVRLSEVLTNLLANAVRHTPVGGHVTVHVSGNGGNGVAFDVDDTGSGIPAEQRAAVFDRFVTAADSGGTGLGLAIARRLVEAHGGTIAATTAPGGGTRMHVELPVDSTA